MTKKELIKEVAKQLKASVAKTEEFYNTVEDTLMKAITSNEEVVLSPKIGKFVLKTRKAYMGRNPKTRKKLKIPAKTVVAFKMSKSIKDEVKKVKLE